MSLSPGFLDELKARTSLSHVVGRKVTWDRRKSNPARGDLWAPCPFHQEKSASFHVDDRKGFYHCFGCGANAGRETCTRGRTSCSSADGISRRKRDGTPYMSWPCRRRVSA